MSSVKRAAFTQDQVFLIEQLNCLLLDLSDELEGFDDDMQGDQIIDLVLDSQGWEWEEFFEKFMYFRTPSLE